MITRRQTLIAFGAGAFATLASFAQAQPKIWRIGFFYNGSRQSAVDTGRYGAFMQGMRELGYIEGKTFIIEERFVSDWDAARLAAVAAELVKANVDIIVATGGPTVNAAKQATASVPIVLTLASDPVSSGFAASLAHPGGNITGVSAYLDEVSPKHIEYLKLVAPKLSRIGLLAKKGNPSNARLQGRIETDARKVGLRVLPVEVDSLKELEPAISRLAQQRAGGFIILGDSFFVQHAAQIAKLATRNRLPSIYTGAEYPEAGGLMSYGPSFADNFRRAAMYVDKILKGAKPGELPIEQPTRFYFTINGKTAKVLGIKISNELLLRADKVIE